MALDHTHALELGTPHFVEYFKTYHNSVLKPTGLKPISFAVIVLINAAVLFILF
jgi:hypothetical protein